MLLRRYVGRHLHEYSLIENSFDKLVNENESILIRMKNYEDRMKSYESAARTNLLLRLLKGYFEDIEDQKLLEELESWDSTTQMMIISCNTYEYK